MQKKHGVTKKEIVAVITHVAMYVGCPKGWATFNLAKNIWNEKDEKMGEKEHFQNEIFFPIGELNSAFSQYFTGQSYLCLIAKEPFPIRNVTFEPKCRNNWHIHRAKNGGGQLLICAGGNGWFQEEGKKAVPMIKGSIVNVPANVKHWHGATRDNWFSHLAIAIPGENATNEWCEPLSNEEYEKL